MLTGVMMHSLRTFLLLGLVVPTSACSEAVAPPSTGGAQVGWPGLGPTTGGGSCAIGTNHVGEIGVVNAAANNVLETDGLNGAEVACIATQSGDSFRVQAQLVSSIPVSGFVVGLSVNVPAISLSATDTSPAAGSVAYYSNGARPNLQGTSGSVYTSVSGEACNFWLEQGQELAPGRAWMQFSCPHLVDGSVNSHCQLGESTVLVQNCDP
jgi:hypothetical protein